MADLTPELVYDFIIKSCNKDGRRAASPMLVYADMVTSRTVTGHEEREWQIVGECLAVLAAHELIEIQHGPETDLYGGLPTAMIQVRNWRLVRPKRTPIPDPVRCAVYERDGYGCVHCGSGDDLTLDHVVPWSRGGSDEESNLQTLCRTCNSSKGNRGGY